jgi:hypothetical protein
VFKIWRRTQYEERLDKDEWQNLRIFHAGIVEGRQYIIIIILAMLVVIGLMFLLFADRVI